LLALEGNCGNNFRHPKLGLVLKSHLHLPFTNAKPLVGKMEQEETVTK